MKNPSRAFPFRLLLLVFASVTITAAAQNEKTVWILVTDARGKALPNVLLKDVSWGKTVTTTSSGRAGVPVAVNARIGDLIYIAVLSRQYETVNGMPFGVRISSFNKPHEFTPITLVQRAQSSLTSRNRVGRRASFGDTASDPFEKGIQALTSQRFPEAEAHFLKSLEARKQVYERVRTKTSARLYGKVNLELGVTYMALNRWRDAYERLQEAFRINPDEETSFMFGIVAMTVGDLPKAESIFREMAASQKQDGRLLGTQFASKIYQSYGKLDDASRLDQEYSKQFSKIQLFRSKEIDDLLKVLNEVTDDVVTNPNIRHQARSMLGQGLIIFHKANIAFIENDSGAFSPQIVEPLQGLASVLQGRERYYEAEALLKRSLSVQERLFGREHVWLGVSYDRLGDLELDRQNYQQAEKHYRNAATIFERSLGSDNHMLDMVDESLVKLYQREGKFKDAEEKLLALKQRRCSRDIYNLDCMRILVKLSELHDDQKKYPEAIVSGRQALDVAKRLWAAKDPMGTAIIFEMIGDLENLYRKSNQQAEAQALQREKEEIVSLGVLPAEHEESGPSKGWTTAVSLNGNHCGFEAPHQFVNYPKTKKVLEAAQKAARYIESRDPDLAELWFTLALTYHREGQFDRAKKLLNHAIVANEASLEPNRRVTAVLLSLRGSVESGLGNLPQAEKDYSESVKILQIVDRNSDEIPAVLFSLGSLQIEMQKFDEAEETLKRALDMREQSKGWKSACSLPDSVTILNELATLYVHTRRYVEAEQSFRQALAAIGEQNLVSYRRSPTILEDFASLLEKTGRNAEAADLRAKAQKIKHTN